MPRSSGITASAVIAIIGSVFTLLGGFFVVLGSIMVPKMEKTPTGVMTSIFIFEALIFFGFGAWGLASGIGLLKLKPWARISLLIYAAILAFISLPTALLMLFVPFPGVNDPNLPPHFMLFIRVGIALFYAMLAALAIFWLYFFNKRSVKAQFSSAAIRCCL